MKRILAALIAATLLLAGFALAVVKPGDDFYYLDTADVLSQEAEGVIYFCNQQLYEACGGQIVVAAVDSIGSADTYEYAYELFNEWGIGSAEENNGFLLLMAIEEDDYYALSGSGVEGIFSSSAIKKLNDTYLEPDFAAKDYEAGALKYFEQVLDRYADKYNLDLDIQDGYAAYEAFTAASAAQQSSYGGARSGGAAYGGQQPPHKEDDGGSILIYVIIFVIIVAIVAFGSRRGGRRRTGGSPVVFVGSRRPRTHYHAGPRPGAPRPGAPRPAPRPSVRTSSRRPGGSGRSGGGFGGFSGRSGGGGFGGFGGGSGGGGGSFGGGGGRGRH